MGDAHVERMNDDLPGRLRTRACSCVHVMRVIVMSKAASYVSGPLVVANFT